MTNAANIRDIATKQKRAKSDSETEKLVLRTLMSQVDGRRYIWLRLSECNVWASTFTGDALTGAFREGERNVGLKLFGAVSRLCPNEFMCMTIENSAVELKEEDNGRSSSDDDSRDDFDAD